jgi:prepilin-type N-terminal cleavage/methylation domain-containing protein
MLITRLPQIPAQAGVGQGCKPVGRMPGSGPYPTPAGRGGFTLLEVVCAMTIAVLLLAAVYSALNITTRQAQAGRDLVERSTLAREILNRIARDIRATVGAGLPPMSSSGGGSGRSGSGGAGSGGSAGSSGGAASGAGSSPSSSSSSSSTTVTSNLAQGTNSPQFNVGVQGDSQTLTLYVGQPTHEVYRTSPMDSDPTQPVPASDLRRISYWLAGSGGLARQEVPVLTGQDMLNLPPTVNGDESSLVMADEVKSLTFQYYDGTNWNDTWDGSQAGTDGVTMMGPPVAIQISIDIASLATGDPERREARVKTYKQTVVIMTANGQAEPSTWQSTNSSSGSSGSTSNTGGTGP